MARKIKALVNGLVLILSVIQSNAANDYPHFGINNIGCDSCHFIYGTQPSLLPPWTAHTPQDIDDTQYNTLCWSCHNDIDAPFNKTHSSLQIDNSYGNWTVECRVCHNPHYQRQMRTYGSASYLYSGVSTGLSASTLTKTGAGWTVNAYQGYVLYPNVLQKNYNYEILSNTVDTITVQGTINQTKAAVGNTFAVIYGGLIKDTIDLSKITITPAKSGIKTTMFFRATGDNSFADGNATYDGICEVCHTQTTHFRNNGGGPDQLHTNMGSIPGTNCTTCHKHVNGFAGMGGGAHPTHVTIGTGPKLACADCHGSNAPPTLADGQNLANTTACNNCHSTDGAVTAKTYWSTDPGTWLTTEGEAGYCGGCHDATPGNTKANGTGDTTVNIVGNKTTYGYFVTGHGKTSGNYARLSWQSTSESGNPAGNKSCSACHDLTLAHFNSGTKRLKAGYANDANNSNCKQCHNPGTAATTDPQWYTTYSAYQSSAHGGKKCTDCHDVHGASGAYAGMTKGSKQNLCYQCHKDPASGGIQNNAISGSSLANNIQQAFNLSSKHDLGTSFTKSSKNYSLECVSCHNVHIITGKYWEADQDKSPVTRFSNNTSVWGDSSLEKMDYYANPGKYQKPMVTANTYDNTKLPDYATFCLDCHSNAIGSILAKNWDTDPHGKKTAGLTGMITGGGVTGGYYGGPKDCPDWKGCGRAFDWSIWGCNPSGTNNDCWPVIPKGEGTGAWVLGGYSQRERNAGVNYVMSCTDCHEAHGSTNYSMMRKALNREYDEADIPLTNDQTVWDDAQSPSSLGLCEQCHQPENTREHSYNPGWHNNSTCATGPCHAVGGMDVSSCNALCHTSFGGYSYIDGMWYPNWQPATFHENRRKGNNSQTATTEPGLVFHYKFESSPGRLKDSNTWNLHGFKVSGTISYVAGKVGDAAVFNDAPVEVGTEANQWGSTSYNSGGPRGNTSKFTEMKYNTTVEAWVYPTSNPSDGYERKIVAKHNYWSGGFAFMLRIVNGQYRAGFVANVGYGGLTSAWETDAYNTNGLRGAFSSEAIPTNQWTHVAATFDTAGPDGTSGDRSIGRIKIYVNGRDVTTSDALPSAWAEPQADNPNTWDEPFITPYTEAPWRDVSDNGSSALSVGGLNWSAPNDNFVGRLDEVKLWYITKPVSYFTDINHSIPPVITSAVVYSIDKVKVYFSEPVYANSNSTGNLQSSDFSHVDTGNNNNKSIIGVSHTAGDTSAILTLNANIIQADIGADTFAAVSNSIFDSTGTAADTSTVILSGSLCPSVADFEMNWTAKNPGDTVTDEAGLLTGVVNRPDLRIKSVVGSAGSASLAVTFSKGVYTNTGSSGALTTGDFQFIDGDDSRTISAVSHTAGATTATVTLSSALDATNDIGVDRLGPASASAIYDNTSTGMANISVTVTSAVPSLTTAIPGDGYFHGDGMPSMNFIKFESQNTCLQVSTNLTLEARIKPQGIPNDSVTYYVSRIFSKRADSATDISGTCTNCEPYQMSVWRQPKDCLYNGYNKAPCSIIPKQWSPNYIPQPGVASISLMTIPYDWQHGDTTTANKWKPVLTEATNASSPEYCPIVNDHWYYVKLVWNTATGGASGHPTADIFVEDQGTDGAGAGKNWTGLKNCTDADQSQFPVSPYTTDITNKRLYSGDYIITGSGRFTLGGPDTDFSYNEFNGLIDWITVQNW